MRSRASFQPWRHMKLDNNNYTTRGPDSRKVCQLKIRFEFWRVQHLHNPFRNEQQTKRFFRVYVRPNWCVIPTAPLPCYCQLQRIGAERVSDRGRSLAVEKHEGVEKIKRDEGHVEGGFLKFNWGMNFGEGRRVEMGKLIKWDKRMFGEGIRKKEIERRHYGDTLQKLQLVGGPQIECFHQQK